MSATPAPRGGGAGVAEFYYAERAGLSFTGEFITAEQARRLLAARVCTGDLVRGFWFYCVRFDDGLALVRVRVTPVAAELLPPDAAARAGRSAAVAP